MSRIGKNPIEIPKGVEVRLEGSRIKVKGPKGELTQEIHPLVRIALADNQVKIDIDDKEDKQQKALWGLFGSLIRNMIVGVTEGYEKKLEINGVGYKAVVSGKNVVFNLGYSHPVEFPIPDGISVEVDKNLVTVSGFDKQLVGEVAAQIRNLRKPEPYKGKGIKYVDEVIRRKVGKALKGAEGA
ncbi:MAG TPA: 50S ribosomal protein L6 [Patescibacteria group bacterium]